MVKKENIFNMVIVLTIICAVSAFALSLVYNITKEPIAKQKRLEMIKAIKSVMPEGVVNDPLKDKIIIDNKIVYIGKNSEGLPIGGQLIGRAYGEADIFDGALSLERELKGALK
jgi:hypothetical protein